MTRVCPSAELLAARVASIPAALSEAALVALPSLAQSPRTIVTTGIGASEGPARLLASTLTENGLCAHFSPLSAFCTQPPHADLLVVFSQGLSPNAQLAFQSPTHFSARWLVTSQHAPEGDALHASGVTRIVIPPASEDGLLLRVVGPTVASLIALRIAAHFGAASIAHLDFAQAAQAYASPRAMQAHHGSDLALIAAGMDVEVAHAHRWKVLEGLLIGDVPTWDVLQFAHGPRQAIHHRKLCILALATPCAAELVERAAATLHADRHRLLPIISKRNDALAFFEHAAALDALVLATLTAYPRDLKQWPGQGSDAPLYDVGKA